MKVEETKILDRNSIRNVPASKILFAESLIQHFTPLFYEETRKKQRGVAKNESEILKLKSDIFELRKKLASRNARMKSENLKAQILEEIKSLLNIDVIYGKNRLNVKSIIDSLDSQTEQDLIRNLSFVKSLVQDSTKRVQKRG